LGARYIEMEIRTASPEMLVVKLYEGAMRHIRVARDAQQPEGVSRRAEAISKAVAIINELQQSLDVEVGGEMAQNLDSLYTFVTERLLDANLEKRSDYLDECLGVLKPLHSAWETIARNPPKEASLR